jgi:ribulose-5-phosphate 4-epimerase/fuculose-1-phosphate aldolase
VGSPRRRGNAAAASNYGGDDPRVQLVQLGRDVTQAGLVVGSGGNLSARTAGSDEFWVTAAGTWLDRLDRGSFVPVRVSDARVRGAAFGRPTTEVALHVATYRARPDVNAIVHLHPQATVLLDALGERIRLITTDHAYYIRRIATTPFHSPSSQELAAVAAQAAQDGTNCVILAHHGCSVLGESVEMAHRRAANLEEAARLTYRALMLAGALGGREITECPTEFLEAGAV